MISSNIWSSDCDGTCRQTLRVAVARYRTRTMAPPVVSTAKWAVAQSIQIGRASRNRVGVYFGSCEDVRSFELCICYPAVHCGQNQESTETCSERYNKQLVTWCFRYLRFCAATHTWPRAIVSHQVRPVIEFPDISWVFVTPEPRHKTALEHCMWFLDGYRCKYT